MKLPFTKINNNNNITIKIMIMITIIEQTKFTLSPSEKAFEKQIKQLNINEKDK